MSAMTTATKTSPVTATMIENDSFLAWIHVVVIVAAANGSRPDVLSD